MKQLYGLSFVTIYGEVPGALWVGEIEKLTDAECRLGLTVLATQKREYPANLTEFREACKPHKAGVRFLGRQETAEERRRMLDRPRANLAHVDACLARMRAKLGVSRETSEACDGEPTE
jgi:hypothetical protein